MSLTRSWEGGKQWYNPPPYQDIHRHIIGCHSRARRDPGTSPSRGCRGRAATRTALRLHIFRRKFSDIMFILEEVNLHRPRFPCCFIMVLWSALNGRHATITQCAKGEERKRCRLVAEEIRSGTARLLQAYRRPINLVTSFNYLG